MMKLQTLSKPIVRLFEPDDTRKLCSFNVHNDVFGDLQVNTRRVDEEFEYDTFIIELKNKMGNVFGDEIFRLEKDCQEIDGKDFNVREEYRNNKHFRFGEIIRLASIIEMIENQVKTLKIRSKGSAIYFHSKYKFTPDMMASVECDEVLKSIIKNSQRGFESIGEVAREILAKSQRVVMPDEQIEVCSQANMLAELYTQEVLKTKDLYKSHPIEYGMGMELTMDSVLKNREFFNSLFKKHGIDYQI